MVEVLIVQMFNYIAYYFLANACAYCISIYNMSISEYEYYLNAKLGRFFNNIKNFPPCPFQGPITLKDSID